MSEPLYLPWVMASVVLRVRNCIHLHKASIGKVAVRKFSLNYALSTSAREARFLSKIMGRHKPKEKFYQNDFDSVPSNHGFKRPVDKRRMAVLNKLFMKNITEVLATGSSSYSIEGLGIEISKVSISSDFKIVNIMYYSKVKPRPDELEELLVNAGFSLRHDLSQLKLMGEVPLIQFVEDKTLSRLMKVEELLSVADKGPDDDLHDFENESSEQEALELLDISQRAYGLNHSKILQKIMTSVRASSVNHRKADVPIAQEAMQYNTTSSKRSYPQENPKNVVKTFLKESRAELKS